MDKLIDIKTRLDTVRKIFDSLKKDNQTKAGKRIIGNCLKTLGEIYQDFEDCSDSDSLNSKEKEQSCLDLSHQVIDLRLELEKLNRQKDDMTTQLSIHVEANALIRAELDSERNTVALLKDKLSAQSKEIESSRLILEQKDSLLMAKTASEQELRSLLTSKHSMMQETFSQMETERSLSLSYQSSLKEKDTKIKALESTLHAKEMDVEDALQNISCLLGVRIGGLKELLDVLKPLLDAKDVSFAQAYCSLEELESQDLDLPLDHEHTCLHLKNRLLQEAKARLTLLSKMRSDGGFTPSSETSVQEKKPSSLLERFRQVQMETERSISDREEKNSLV